MSKDHLHKRHWDINSFGTKKNIYADQSSEVDHAINHYFSNESGIVYTSLTVLTMSQSC